MKFGTVVVDPPWEYPEGWPAWGKRKGLEYPTMTVDEIAALRIDRVMLPEHYVWLWTTDRYLGDALRILGAWRCQHRQTLIWSKPPRGLGPGGMLAITHEYALVGQRINAGTRAHGRRTSGVRLDRSVYEWPRGRHSEKPAQFYDLVRRVGRGPFLDVFARETRLGWSVVGNEVDGLDCRDALAALEAG